MKIKTSDLTERENMIFDAGFREGESKQAILENHARDRFVASFREKVDKAVNDKLTAARLALEAK